MNSSRYNQGRSFRLAPGCKSPSSARKSTILLVLLIVTAGTFEVPRAAADLGVEERGEPEQDFLSRQRPRPRSSVVIAEGERLDGQPQRLTPIFDDNRVLIAVLETSSDLTPQIAGLLSHPAGIASLSWSSDSRLVATATNANGPGFLAVWNAASGDRIAQASLNRTRVMNAEVPIALSSSRGIVIVPGRLDWPNGRDAALLWQFQPDLAPSAGQNRVYQWRVRPIGSSPTLPWPLDVSPSTRFMFRRIEIDRRERLVALAADSDSGELIILTTDGWRQIGRIPGAEQLVFNDVRFSNEGDLVAIAVRRASRSEGTHRVIIADATLEHVRRTISVPGQRIISAAFSGDDKLVVTGSGGARNRRSALASRVTLSPSRLQDHRSTDVNDEAPPIRVWDVATGREVGEIEGPDAGIPSMDWSRDNSAIAAVFGDHSVVIWGWPSRTILMRIRPAASAASSRAV